MNEPYGEAMADFPVCRCCSLKVFQQARDELLERRQWHQFVGSDIIYISEGLKQSYMHTLRVAHAFHTCLLAVLSHCWTETRLVHILHNFPLFLVEFAGHFDGRVKWFCTHVDKWLLFSYYQKWQMQLDVTSPCPTHSGGHFSVFLSQNWLIGFALNLQLYLFCDSSLSGFMIFRS